MDTQYLLIESNNQNNLFLCNVFCNLWKSPKRFIILYTNKTKKDNGNQFFCPDLRELRRKDFYLKQLNLHSIFNGITNLVTLVKMTKNNGHKLLPNSERIAAQNGIHRANHVQSEDKSLSSIQTNNRIKVTYSSHGV